MEINRANNIRNNAKYICLNKFDQLGYFKNTNYEILKYFWIKFLRSIINTGKYKFAWKKWYIK
jgi:hypothetical protein